MNYHYLPASKDVRDVFVRRSSKVRVVVFLGGAELRLVELVGCEHESAQLLDFNNIDMMAFGHRLRPISSRSGTGSAARASDEADAVNRISGWSRRSPASSGRICFRRTRCTSFFCFSRSRA